MWRNRILTLLCMANRHFLYRYAQTKFAVETEFRFQLKSNSKVAMGRNAKGEMWNRHGDTCYQFQFSIPEISSKNTSIGYVKLAHVLIWRSPCWFSIAVRFQSKFLGSIHILHWIVSLSDLIKCHLLITIWSIEMSPANDCSHWSEIFDRKRNRCCTSLLYSLHGVLSGGIRLVLTATANSSSSPWSWITI